MIRGTQTVISLFPNAIKTASKKGGNKGIYTFDRDVCICYRYYFHYEVSRVRHDDVLTYLEKEFFISATTIMDRLTDNAGLLKDIVNNKPSRISLKRKYPHFSWN